MQIEMQLHAFLNNLKVISNYSSSTLEAYRNDLTRYLLFLRESIKRIPVITDFTPETISSYLNAERMRWNDHLFNPEKNSIQCSFLSARYRFFEQPSFCPDSPES